MVTLAASRYLMNGEIVERGEGGDNYRNGVLPIDFMPGFNLEGLPNRDSLKYKQEYGLHDANTVLRGTLRYKVSALVTWGRQWFLTWGKFTPGGNFHLPRDIFTEP